MNILKNILIASVFAFVGVLVLSTASVARAEEVENLVPSVQGENATVVSTPVSTGSNDAEGGTTLVPTNSGSNDAEAGTTDVPTSQGANNDETPSTNTSTGGGSSGGASVGGGSSSGTNIGGGSVLGASTGVVLGDSCPLISTFMTVGGSNNGVDVAKLQAFLKANEKMNVSVTGIYDAQTVEAVKAFQAKYLNEIMHPWGAAVPSGRVYITTLKKINQLACAQPLTLSASEIAIIEAYKNKQNQTTTVGSTDTGSNQNGTTTDNMIGSNNNESNTAAAANSSVIERFWNFLKNIF